MGAIRPGHRELQSGISQRRFSFLMNPTSMSPKSTKEPFKPIAGLCVVLFVVTIIGGWLYVDNMRNDLEAKIEHTRAGSVSTKPVQQEAAPPETPPVVSELTFDPATVAVGDMIGSWKVVAIDGDESGSPRRVQLAGTATVSGTYTSYSDDEPFFSGRTVFRTDEAATAIVPRATTWKYSDPNGTAYRFFAFVDGSAVGQAFGPKGSTGQAIAVIRDYTVNLIEGEAFDTAEFVRRADR